MSRSAPDGRLQCGCEAGTQGADSAAFDTQAHITAFEVNEQSADAARATLNRLYSHRVRVVTGRSTEPKLLEAPPQSFEVLLHEVFGVFASSEGCPQMLAHAREHYLVPPSCAPPSSLPPPPPSASKTKKRRAAAPPPLPSAPPHAISIPSRSATFFTPCELRASSLDGCENVFVNRLLSPKVILAPCAPLDRLSLAACVKVPVLAAAHAGRSPLWKPARLLRATPSAFVRREAARALP